MSNEINNKPGQLDLYLSKRMSEIKKSCGDICQTDDNKFVKGKMVYTKYVWLNNLLFTKHVTVKSRFKNFTFMKVIALFFVKGTCYVFVTENINLYISKTYFLYILKKYYFVDFGYIGFYLLKYMILEKNSCC